MSVYSGDDHDYCEVLHPENKNHARETTVKSMSMAMGVRKPGFLMLSMWNPIGLDGNPLHSNPSGHGAVSQRPMTTESHLCLLPDQISILIKYGYLVVLTITALLVRAILTPILKLSPFAFSTSSYNDDNSLLPTSKQDLKRREDTPMHRSPNSSTSSTSSNHFNNLAPRSSAARTRSVSPANGYGLPSNQVRYATPPLINSAGYNASYAPPSFEDEKSASRGGVSAYDLGKSKANDSLLKIVFREAWHSIWRVTWMVMLIYLWLAYFG
jgi:hypothetical protein